MNTVNSVWRNLRSTGRILSLFPVRIDLWDFSDQNEKSSTAINFEGSSPEVVPHRMCSTGSGSLFVFSDKFPRYPLLKLECTSPTFPPPVVSIRSRVKRCDEMCYLPGVGGREGAVMLRQGKTLGGRQRGPGRTTVGVSMAGKGVCCVGAAQ